MALGMALGAPGKDKRRPCLPIVLGCGPILLMTRLLYPLNSRIFSLNVAHHSFLSPPRCSRHLARKHLKPTEVPFTMTSFPRLGAPGVFTEPYFEPAGAVSSHSLFLPEEITNPHARFPSVASLHVFSLALNHASLFSPQDPHGQYPPPARLQGRD